MKMILVEIKNDICTLTINRPEQYNALNIDVLKLTGTLGISS